MHSSEVIFHYVCSFLCQAILLDGAEHDSDVNNVIVFSGKVGVNSTNGANRMQGVHTWNLAGAQGGALAFVPCALAVSLLDS